MRFAVAVLALVLLAAPTVHGQPGDGLPPPAGGRARSFERLTVTISDISRRTSTIVVTPDGAVTVDGRKGALSGAEPPLVQSAFEAYDDSYRLTDGHATEETVKLSQPEEDWYVPPITVELEVRTKTTRQKCSFTLPQLDRLDRKRVEHALVRTLLDVRSRVLLQNASATLTTTRPGALRTTTSAEIARLTSDGVFIVETRTTKKKQGKLQTSVYPTWQRLATAEELSILRDAAAQASGDALDAKAVIRLPDGTLHPASDALAAMLNLEKHGGPKPGASPSPGIARALDGATPPR